MRAGGGVQVDMGRWDRLPAFQDTERGLWPFLGFVQVLRNTQTDLGTKMSSWC